MGERLRWRVHRDGADTGSWNMAMDHALARTLEAGRGAVRFYGWVPHTISFGRNEPAKGLYDTDAAQRERILFVRRPTGGRAVFHSHEITYSVVAPLYAFGGLRAAYTRINEGLVKGLRALGLDVELSDGSGPTAPDAGPCFQLPASGEVVLGGRKLVGSAQVRVGRALLQHGSVIMRGDQSILARLTGHGDHDPAPPATVEEVLGATSTSFVVDSLAEGLRTALGGTWTEGPYRSEHLAAARYLEDERYRREAWTWRR
ncbi:MAG: lipoate--protein ligase family protein [Gemmatimonadetes bacterium]|nr:lipoate--protein ligase family protein [Gemmatimonadota bacterium]